MWYMPYLRVRHAVLVYSCIAAGIALVAVALRFWPGAVHMDANHFQGHVSFGMIVAGSAALVGGFATVLGLNLAAENDGHLELAWTKPITREGYALGVFAVDIAAMAVSIAFTTVCAMVVIDVYAGYQAVIPDTGPDFVRALAFVGFPLCVYGWVTALSASLRSNRGAAAGVFWPLMLGLGALVLVPVPVIHAVVSALNLFNPVEIFSIKSNVPEPSVWTLMWGWAVAVLGLVAALFQWRRLQL